MKRLERVFKGLANRRRLAIIQMLSKREEASVADIAEHISLSFTSTSKHLGLLHRIDVVDKRQDGLTVYYRLSNPLPQVVSLVSSHIANSRE
ncbi:MAG: winged helix-turn-helix transcriptional regulator [Candidatus Liptonbacteria bacterium]|nr:winged helix-turn-helix transcriptional regulator [Candidatus Liptonbacteria bacterium]